MTKPVENPAKVIEATGNPFELQAKTKAVLLLSNNTVWLRNNYILENYLKDDKQREALIALYDTTPLVTLEAATDSRGKAITQAGAPIMLKQYATAAYDTRKMGRLMLLDRDALIVIGTHYHTSKGVSFSYPAFQKALVEYCHLATLEGRQQDPVIIPVPGLECADVMVSGKIDRDHIDYVKRIIANTMFPNANVTLVIPN